MRTILIILAGIAGTILLLPVIAGARERREEVVPTFPVTFPLMRTVYGFPQAVDRFLLEGSMKGYIEGSSCEPYLALSKRCVVRIRGDRIAEAFSDAMRFGVSITV